MPVSEASENPTCVLIDGEPLVQALRKPCNYSTFDDYEKEFLRKTLQLYVYYVTPNVWRLDVVFDTCIKKSIKTSTREKKEDVRRDP